MAAFGATWGVRTAIFCMWSLLFVHRAAVRNAVLYQVISTRRTSHDERHRSRCDVPLRYNFSSTFLVGVKNEQNFHLFVQYCTFIQAQRCLIEAIVIARKRTSITKPDTGSRTDLVVDFVADNNMLRCPSCLPRPRTAARTQRM